MKGLCVCAEGPTEYIGRHNKWCADGFDKITFTFFKALYKIASPLFLPWRHAIMGKVLYMPSITKAPESSEFQPIRSYSALR